MIQLEVRPIADFCGLDFEPAMLRGDGLGRRPREPVRRRTDLVGRPSEPSPATAWKQPLSARQLEIFGSVAADLPRHPDYEPRHGSRAKTASRSERIRAVDEACRARLRKLPRDARERRRRARDG